MNILIPQAIQERIMFYVNKSDIECSGLGTVEVTEEGYKVTDIVLLKQENTSTHTEIDPQAVTRAMFELKDAKGGLYFWWHSHVNMPAFWSGTDVATIEEIGSNGLCVAVVFNKKEEMKGAVYLAKTKLSPDLYFDDIPVKIARVSASEEVRAAWAKEFEEKCKPKYSHAISLAQTAIEDQRTHVNRDLPDDFDIIEFEEKNFAPDDRVKLAHLQNAIMYSYSVTEIDEDLKKILELVKGSRANKKHKRKAYAEYKQLALDQKNYLAEQEAIWERMGKRHHA